MRWLTRYVERFQPYVRGTSGQFIYHLKGQATAPHLQDLGELFHDLGAASSGGCYLYPTQSGG